MFLVDQTWATKCSEPGAMLNIFQEEAWRSNVTPNRGMDSWKPRGQGRNAAVKETLPPSKKLLSEGSVGVSSSKSTRAPSKERISMLCPESTSMGYAYATQVRLLLPLTSP